MFDIGFWEVGLVGLVALLVIGPERLPGVVKLSGFWLGKTRRMVASVKQEIKDELYAEELRQSILENSPTEELKNLVKDVSLDPMADETGDKIENSIVQGEKKQPLRPE